MRTAMCRIALVVVLFSGVGAGAAPGFYPAVRTTFSSLAETEPWVSDDSLTMYYSIDQVLGTGVDIDIFISTRVNASSAWSAGSPAPNINISGYINSEPWISPDGLRIYYRAEDPPKLHTATRANPSLSFSAPVQLSGSINSGYGSEDPSLTADQLTIVFTHRPLLADDADIYIATRASTGASFGTPLPLTEINTASTEQSPHISLDGLSIFWVSDTPGGEGGYDVYYASRTSLASSFGTPVNISSVNTSNDEHGVFLHEPSGYLYFGRNMSPGTESFDIYQAAPYLSTITTEHASCQAGHIVAIPVRSEGDWHAEPDIAFTVQFDPAILKPLGAILPLNATNRVGSTAGATVGTNTISCTLSHGTTVTGSNVPLVDLVFEVAGSAVVGQTSPVNITSATNVMTAGPSTFTVIQTGWVSPWELYR